MPASFTSEQQAKIKEKLFHAGTHLCRTLGVQRMTVSKLTASCGIAKGSFYSFYKSKEEFILALIEWANHKAEEMLSRKLAGRRQMSTHEFLEFYRDFLYSEYDLMNVQSTEDFLWLKKHMAEADLFNPNRQSEELGEWLKLINDVRDDIDIGTVINLIKSIYAMREHRDTFVTASLDNSIEMVLRMLGIYVSGKGELL